MLGVRGVAIAAWLAEGAACRPQLQSSPEGSAAAVYTGLDDAEHYAGLLSRGVGDVSGDGFDDIAVNTNYGPEVFFGSAHPENASVSESDFEFHATRAWNTPVAVGPGDVNGDGYADLVISQGYSGAALLYGPLARGQLETGAEDIRFGEAEEVVSGVQRARDANADGLGDVWLINPSAAILVFGGSALDSVSLAEAGTQVIPPDGYSFGPLGAVGIGDIDGDGVEEQAFGEKRDLAHLQFSVGSIGEAPGTTAVADLPIQVLAASDGGYGEPVVSWGGDVNGDGYLDLTLETGNAHTLMGGSHPGWTSIDDAALNWMAPCGTSARGVGDSDGDGYDDTVISDCSVAWISYGAANPIATIAAESALEYPGEACSGGDAAGDVNGDGLADWLAMNPEQDVAGMDGAGATWLFLGERR